MSYIDHVVKRGVEHATSKLIKRAVEDGPQAHFSSWGVNLMAASFVVLLVFLIGLQYMLREVVATLAMIESPSAAITVSASEEQVPLKNTKDDVLETGPTITLVHQKPITSSIRGTIRHVVALAGRFARWRGFKSYLLYNICQAIMVQAFYQILPSFPGSIVLASALSGALLVNLHVAWTHKVISMPTQKSFIKRIASRSDWKQLVLPATVQASVSGVCQYLMQAFVVLFGLDRIHNQNVASYSGNEVFSLVMRALSILAIAIVMEVFIILPASVTLIRVEASILPEDQDTIVPFDRTFDGKVVPKILGGTGCVGFVDAWKSFKWEARRRLIKLYAKVVGIETFCVIIFAHLLAFGFWLSVAH